MKKSLNKELGKLCMLCYEISTTTERDVFFSFSPHINYIDVRIYENGWKEEAEPIYLTRIAGDEITFRTIDKVKAKLQKYRGEK